MKNRLPWVRRTGLAAAMLALLCAAPVGASPSSTAIKASFSPSIVGGTRAAQGEYPAQGYLQIYRGGSYYACGGTLIGTRYFVTAAHCVVDPATLVPVPAANLLILMGDVDLAPPNTDVYGVTSVDVNATYARDASKHGNDIAMLKLDRPAPYTLLRVITPSESAKWAPGTSARIIGWGTTSSGGSASQYLLKADVPIVTDAVCGGAYGTSFDPTTMVCAGDGIHDTCQGDSGGPLMVPDGASFVLAGVVSFGKGCADPNFPGVYTRIGAPGLNGWLHARYPWAAFTASPSRPRPNQVVTLTSTSFHPDGPSGFTTFHWDFNGDGVYDDASGASVTAKVGGPGTYLVGLEASKPGGDRAVTTQPIVVPSTARCVVPKVKGKTLRAAKAAIKRASCRVGKVKRVRSAKKLKGRVVSQSPRAGRILPVGGKVSLKVGTGRR